MVDELVRMVAGMQEIVAKLPQGGLRIQPDGFVNVNGFWVRSATRIPTYAAHRRDAAGTRARAMTRSPSDLLPTPILANSRARLPPLTGIHPSPPPPSPLATAVSTNSARLFRRRLLPQAVAPSSPSAEILRTINLPSSPSQSRTRSRSRSPPPPRAARNRVFHMSQNSNSPPRRRPHTPSPAARPPSPLGTPTTPQPQPQPSGSGFSSYESPSASLIAETRTRLPPPPDSSPILHRPPGQRLFSFLHRL
ncbi:hypothetical protein BGY98DRAFT_1018803 [Russula aff. rugulosa BPL654]|nr:hypothetical protein BGY98DRAFT_1018803 [Russula aff. rugulosa BPL654]